VTACTAGGFAGLTSHARAGACCTPRASERSWFVRSSSLAGCPVLPQGGRPVLPLWAPPGRYRSGLQRGAVRRRGGGSKRALTFGEDLAATRDDDVAGVNFLRALNLSLLKALNLLDLLATYLPFPYGLIP
jgi:hypothetical protein